MGIFEGIKLMLSTANIYTLYIACMHAAERLLFRENLSNGHSGKILSKYTRYTIDILAEMYSAVYKLYGTGSTHIIDAIAYCTDVCKGSSY